MKRLKKRKILLLVLILLLPFVLFYGLLFIGLGLSAIHNHITLQNFARPFLEYPLPPQTIEVSNSADWGVLTGNGNHCDFEVTRNLRTDLSEGEIRTYYRNIRFSAIVPERSVFSAIAGLDGQLEVTLRFDETQPRLVTVTLFDGIYYGTFWDFACS